ncbi:ABC transporter substrate-binding protein [Haloechinothrix salitolerans]|uniref:ABC transporter substrate-binding protein n=1 Tax=Haloechinothrix salitolerans TaxID=926830 RepID=A0ABW2C047_9PSEU
MSGLSGATRVPRRLVPPRRRLIAAIGGVMLLLAAACGSQLDPATVARANGTALDGQAAAPGDPADVGGGPTDVGTGTGTGGGDASDNAAAGATGTNGSAPTTGDLAGSGENAATGSGSAASCDGFTNQTGITDDTITVANVADISGPVPGLFESAQQSARAYAAYFNASNPKGICGRELNVLTMDGRTETAGDQQAYTRACDEAFAAVGSMVADDSGGAKAAASCGLPDMRSLTTSPARRACQTCFSAYSIAPNLVPAAIPNFIEKKEPGVTDHAAVLYVTVRSAEVNARSYKTAYEKSGFTVDYFQGIDPSEFNYAPYVQQMKDKGIRMVQYFGPYQYTVRLQQAMRQQDYKPDIFLQDPTIYTDKYVEQAGDDGNGSIVYTTNDLFSNMNNKEMKLYRAWLNQVDPNAEPDYFGLYAWSATRLFVEKAVALGGKLNRKSMVRALSKVKDWTSNGLHTGMAVGPKRTSPCAAFIQLNNRKWRKISPKDYLCGPLINTGVGG